MVVFVPFKKPSVTSGNAKPVTPGRVPDINRTNTTPGSETGASGRGDRNMGRGDSDPLVTPSQH